MRRHVTFFLSVLMALLSAQPVAAGMQCAGQRPLLATISSVTHNEGKYDTINLDNITTYNPSSLPENSTNLDTYASIVNTYLENGKKVPSSSQFYSSPEWSIPSWATSYQDYIEKSYNRVYVSTSSLSATNYTIGDVIIIGPPAGGACVQYGFTGIYSDDGKIKSIIADDAQYLPYMFGSEKLTVTPGSDYDCVKSNDLAPRTICPVPITYKNGSESTTVHPGESSQLAGRFSKITLIVSTDTILGGMMSDFYPTTLQHVIMFENSAQRESLKGGSAHPRDFFSSVAALIEAIWHRFKVKSVLP